MPFTSCANNLGKEIHDLLRGEFCFYGHRKFSSQMFCDCCPQFNSLFDYSIKVNNLIMSITDLISRRKRIEENKCEFAESIHKYAKEIEHLVRRYYPFGFF